MVLTSVFGFWGGDEGKTPQGETEGDGNEDKPADENAQNGNSGQEEQKNGSSKGWLGLTENDENKLVQLGKILLAYTVSFYIFSYQIGVLVIGYICMWLIKATVTAASSIYRFVLLYVSCINVCFWLASVVVTSPYRLANFVVNLVLEGLGSLWKQAEKKDP